MLVQVRYKNKSGLLFLKYVNDIVQHLCFIGIGLETARDLSSRGARLILAVRNMEKGINAAKDIMKTTGNNNLVVRKLDLASTEEIRKFAQQINDAEER